MNYKITLRKRLPNNKLMTAIYKLEHVYSNIQDDDQKDILLQLEEQANGNGPVRVWVEEIDD